MKRQRLNRYLAATALLVAYTAHGASVDDTVKEQNTAQCVQLAGKFDKNAPTDKSKLPTYCTCVSAHYWSSVPQSDYEGMATEYQAGNYNGPHAKSLNAHATERQQAAEKACSGT